MQHLYYSSHTLLGSPVRTPESDRVGVQLQPSDQDDYQQALHRLRTKMKQEHKSDEASIIFSEIETEMKKLSEGNATKMKQHVPITTILL